MTMPEKIWASEVKAGYGEWQDAQYGLPMPVPYIRADIVEELVGALEWVSDYLDEGLKLSAQKTIHTALSRINAIMEGK